MDKRIVVRRSVDAAVEKVFEFVADPSRHRDFDRSGLVRTAVGTHRIGGVGDVFVMNMHDERRGGDFVLHNHVTEYVENARLAWHPGPDAARPEGWEIAWDFQPIGAYATEVTLTYDWSGVREGAERFPETDAAALESSLERLAEVIKAE